jgi:iron complex outermembrane receptor protein
MRHAQTRAYRTLALALAACAGAPGASADDASAAGDVVGVVATAGGRGVAGARVCLAGSSGPCVGSAADGSFRLTAVAVGQRRVRAELAGYGQDERSVDVRAGATAQLALTLPYLPFAETLTVTATRTERRLDDSPAHVTVLGRDDVQRWPAAALDQALNHVPSFSLFRRTSSLVSHPTTQGVSLRGVGASGASRTLVLVDGVPHNNPFGNWVYWDDIPQVQIETVEVAPGGLSFLYGSSAMAGVISVTTRRPAPRTAVLQASGGSRGTWDAQGFGSHALGAFSASAAGSFFETDGYVPVEEGQRGPVDEAAASRHRTANWRLEYAPSPRWLVFQSGRVFAEDRANGTPLQVNESRQAYLGGGVRATTGARSVLQANLFSRSNRFESTFSAVSPDRASETLSLAQAVDDSDIGGNLQWTREIGTSHQIGVGGDLRWIDARNAEDVFIAPQVNVRDRSIPARQFYAGAWAQDVITVGRRAVLTLGLRADRWRNYDASQTEVVNASGAATVTPFSDGSRTTITPRAGLLLRVGRGLALRGAAYGGFRAPSLNELYRPFRVGNVLTSANSRLGPERLAGGEVGLNHDPAPTFSWKATAFWDAVEDPIANVTASVTPTLITRTRMNLGRARVRGVGVDGGYRPLPALRLQLGYVLSDARVTRFPATPDVEGNRLPQVPRHRASLSLEAEGNRIASASLRARYESGRYDDDLNQLRLASLFLLDVILERRLGDAWRVFVSAENVFDRRYAVQATPVEQLGTPFTITAGLRFARPPR